MRSDDAASNVLVSLVVPVYNCADYVGEALESIHRQTYRALDVVVVDDGSNDGSSEIIDAWLSRDGRFRVLRGPNRGLQRAWMAGVRASQGQYIGFVDADDWLHPDMVRRMVLAAVRSGADVVQCDLQHVSAHASASFSPPLSAGGEDPLDGPLAARMALESVTHHREDVVPSRWTKLFERSLLLRNLHYCDGTVTIGEDMNIVVPALADARLVLCLRMPMYFYRANPQSMTHTYRGGLFDNAERLFDQLSLVVAEKRLALREQLHEYFGVLTLKAIINECRGPGRLRSRVDSIRRAIDGSRAEAALRAVTLRRTDFTSGVVLIAYRAGAVRVLPHLVALMDWSRACLVRRRRRFA